MSLRDCDDGIRHIAATLVQRSNTSLQAGYPSGKATLREHELSDDPVAQWLLPQFPYHTQMRQLLEAQLKERLGAPCRCRFTRWALGDRWKLKYGIDSVTLFR